MAKLLIIVAGKRVVALAIRLCVSGLFTTAFTLLTIHSGLGSVVVFATTLFALWMGISNGLTAIVIVQAGIFAEASRQLVK